MTSPIRRPVLMAAALAVLGAAWLSSAQVPRDGGPSGRRDSFGYLVLDQTSPLCGVHFVDLQGGGSLLTLEAPHAAPGDPPAADDGGAVWVLGGPFEFYGQAEGALVVSSNGYLGFAASLDREDGRDYSNDAVLPAVPGYTAPAGSPTFSIPARVMAYHGDLAAGAGGTLQAKEFAVCPRPSGAFPGEGCTVVQWSDWAVASRPGETVTFQVLLYHHSFAIALQFQQVDGTGGEGVTVAIQDHRARRALAFATGAAGALTAGGAVCFFEPRFPPGGPLVDLEADLDAGAEQGGGLFELELAVTNDGPSPATGVTAVLSLPAGFEVASSTCPGGLAGGAWAIGDLPPGDWETCLAQVHWSAGPGGLAELTVSGLETDPDPLNNTATVLLAPPLFLVTPSAGPNGSIAPDTPQNVDHGQTAVFTVTPDEGYTALVGGTCGGELVGDLYTTEPITADCTVHAEFELLRWPLTVTLSGPGGGAVTSDPPGIDCPGDCSAGFDHGTVVTLSAEPNSISTFTGWSGGGCSGTGPCVVTMEEARSVTAAFAVIPGIIVPVCLEVDTLDGGGAAGNLNGILEPGETVAVAPTWRNTGSSGVAATGLASELTGPGTGHFLADGTADYGAIPADGDANCGDATGNCYLVSLDVPAERPQLHWDLTFTETLSTGEETTWTIHVGDSFADVGVDHWAYRFIETLLHSGVTAGCGGFDYCPTATLTRWQMAVFLAKAMIGDEALLPDSGTVPGVGDYTCGAGGVSVFDDVPPADPACRHIHSIAAQGVTVGCGGGLYCPSDTVTRWQMAVFLAKAMVGDEALLPDLGTVPGMGGYICGAGGFSVFGDVPPADPACRHIHYIAAQGVTAGCGGGDYCPGGNLARDQMAVFLVKAFGLDLCGAGAVGIEKAGSVALRVVHDDPPRDHFGKCPSAGVPDSGGMVVR